MSIQLEQRERSTNEISTNNPFGLYLNDLNEFSRILLTAEQERSLSKSIEKGLLIKQIEEKREVGDREIIDQLNLKFCGDYWDCLQEVLRRHELNDLDGAIGEGLYSYKKFRADVAILGNFGKEDCDTHIKEISVAQHLLKEMPDEVSGQQKYLDDLKIEEEKARGDLLRANVGLVVRISVDDYGFYKSNQSIGDFIGIGNLGLIRAVEKYDWRRGRFSTCASGWIKSFINRVIKHDRDLTLSGGACDDMQRMNKKIGEITQEVQKEPDNEEIASSLGWKIEKVILLKQSGKKADSLEREISEDGKKITLADSIGDKSISVEEQAIRECLKKDIEDVLESLTPRERQVLRWHYGLDGGRGHTLEEIGQEFRVTKECVRQVEAKALRKLRQSKKLVKIRDYYE
ncbi:MAG: sigma-70 family RNA polymerase sigma factor [Candidatus Levybacteria bacterium]|nr:sigma-70 family RNA polymerase sigma factor [Candidatus Levybacteria bacterium]